MNFLWAGKHLLLISIDAVFCYFIDPWLVVTAWTHANVSQMWWFEQWPFSDCRAVRINSKIIPSIINCLLLWLPLSIRKIINVYFYNNKTSKRALIFMNHKWMSWALYSIIFRKIVESLKRICMQSVWIYILFFVCDVFGCPLIFPGRFSGFYKRN